MTWNRDFAFIQNDQKDAVASRVYKKKIGKKDFLLFLFSLFSEALEPSVLKGLAHDAVNRPVIFFVVRNVSVFSFGDQGESASQRLL